MLLVSIYKYEKEKFRGFYLLVCFFVLLLLGSGTGFILFLVFIYLKYKLYRGIQFLMGLIFIVLISLFILSKEINDGGLLMRLSSDYFNLLINLKYQQFLDVYEKISKSLFTNFFGLNYEHDSVVRVLSDFGWVDFLECFGIIGIPSFLLFLLLNKKILILPIIIMLLGYFHYPMVGSIPGQIILGSLLANELNSKMLRS
jgi:hypothetical protein